MVTLENLLFTAELDPHILAVFQQFCALQACRSSFFFFFFFLQDFVCNLKIICLIFDGFNACFLVASFHFTKGNRGEGRW